MPGRDPHPARRLVPVGDVGSVHHDGDRSGAAGPPSTPRSPGSSAGSIRSWRSRASVLSAGSFASVLSAGSALSAGSFLSVGSVGSILSIGSSGSVLSIGSSGSVLSIGAAGGFLQIGRRPSGSATRDVAPLVAPLAASARALLGGRAVNRSGRWAAATRSGLGLRFRRSIRR
ncbi:MAG: hypothetical protein ACXWBN_01790 [Acidimicrobiales bacterium]